MNLKNRSLGFESFAPFLFEYQDISIQTGSWGNMALEILTALDNKHPKSEEELLNIRYNWSKSLVFSKTKSSNFIPYKNIFLNVNHTSLHSLWSIQQLLTEYDVDLDKARLLIFRHPGGEAPIVREYFRNLTTSSFRSALILNGKSDKSADIIINNFKTINELLREISKAYDDFFLFDDYYRFTSYKDKTIELSEKKFFNKPKHRIAVMKNLEYLNDFYRYRNFYQKLELINFTDNNKSFLLNVINELFDKSEMNNVLNISRLRVHLILKYQKELASIKELNNNDDLFKFVEITYKNIFFFNKPFILREKQSKLSGKELIEKHVYNLDDFRVSDLQEFCESMQINGISNYSQIFQEISDDFVQIEFDRMVKKDLFHFNSHDMLLFKKEIGYYIASFGAINTKSYKGYLKLPKISNYEWNKYLLVGICRTYFSDTFSVENTENRYDTTDYIIKTK